MKIPVYFSSAYSVDGGFDTVGKSAVVARSLSDDSIDGVELLEPRPVHIELLERVHDPDYVQQVLAGRRGQFTEHGADFVASILASTGGVVAAVESALAHGRVVSTMPATTMIRVTAPSTVSSLARCARSTWARGAC
jgi:acetoin utilization deacetylase AcuC-like enzyme